MVCHQAAFYHNIVPQVKFQENVNRSKCSLNDEYLIHKLNSICIRIHFSCVGIVFFLFSFFLGGGGGGFLYESIF